VPAWNWHKDQGCQKRVELACLQDTFVGVSMIISGLTRVMLSPTVRKIAATASSSRWASTRQCRMERGLW